MQINIHSMLPNLVAEKFPSVLDFRVDRAPESAVPVTYEDSQGRQSSEWPPVARWRIGSRHYRYVMKPTFVVEEMESTPSLCRTFVRADYSSELPVLWRILQWSAEGKTADEMNRLLGHR